MIRPTHLLAAVIVLASSAAASAQSIGVNALSVAADHYLLDKSLQGASVTLRTAERGKAVTFQLEVAHARARSGRIGVPCAGLILPGTCPPEPLRDNGRLLSAGGGAALRVLRTQRVTVALTADVSAASVRADTRGLSSGATLTAAKTLWGGTLGARAAWTPVNRVPLALEVGGGIGTLAPISEEMVADGYTPFERRFDVRRVHLGVLWSPSWD